MRDLVFDAVRCRRSFSALGGAETGRGLMLGALRAAGQNPEALFDGSAYAPAPMGQAETGRPPEAGAEALDLPDWLFPIFTNSLGEQAEAAAQALRQRAPIFLRVNGRKAARDEVQGLLAEEGVVTSPHADVETALEVTKGERRLRQTRAYLDGLVELQDAGSQDVVAQLPLAVGARVLDFCAGGGGKSLAMAARWDVEPVLHDAAPQRLKDADARARRAGVRLRTASKAALAQEAPFDLVLCDVPCSGSGAWRRSPEAKWRLTPDDLNQLQKVQTEILSEVAGLVRPGGVLAYVTCSVFRAENQDVVSRFLESTGDFELSSCRNWPINADHDGFFLATMGRERKDV